MFFALRAKEINTRVELLRALWNSQSALISIRILPDLVSSSPFPSPPYFLSSNRQNEIWGQDQDFFLFSFFSDLKKICAPGN